MSEYIEPTQSSFSSAESTIADVVGLEYPSLSTRAGSAIRELVVRPMAYLYSWLVSNLDDSRRKSSMAYLMESQSTDNAVADDIASNYFVTRRRGVRSRGMIAVIIRTPVLQLPAGALFTVGGHQVATEYRIIALDSASSGLVGGVLYVPIIPYSTADGTYMVGIPVIATAAGRVEIPASEEVSVSFGSDYIVSAVIASPITGGMDTETDAEMMSRALYNTAESGIGSYYGIRKKLDTAPVTVTGLCVVAGEDAPVFRARHNSVNINPGGYVDCYVRTQNQYSIGLISVSLTYPSPTSSHSVTLQDIEHAGLYGIRGLTADGVHIGEYTLSFGTDDGYTGPQGARLSVNQVVTVEFSTDAPVSSLSVIVEVLYTPGIYALQQHMNAARNRFVGQDVKIKAAVPVPMRLDCAVKLPPGSDAGLVSAVKQAVVDKVNSCPVGMGALNFSDIQDAVSVTFPGTELRLPCAMSADLILPDGSMDAFYSNTGILDINHPASPDHWDSAMCYFSLAGDHVRLDII